MRGEHRLIRGDDRNSARKRGLDGVECDAIGAADQFNEKVNVGGGGKRLWIGEISSLAEVDSPVAFPPRAVRDHRKVASRSHDQPGVLALKKPNEACPHHPETGDTQAKRVRHCLLAPPRGELDFERSVPSSRLEIKGGRAAQPYRSAADFRFFFRSLRAA